VPSSLSSYQINVNREAIEEYFNSILLTLYGTDSSKIWKRKYSYKKKKNPLSKVKPWKK